MTEPTTGPQPTTFAEPRPGETREEFLERYRRSVPPVLFLPTVEVAPEGEPIQIELRTTSDGKVALLAYSAMDRLVDGCGPHQPFAVVRTESLEELKASQPFDVVYFDMVVPEELRHGPAGSDPAPQDPR